MINCDGLVKIYETDDKKVMALEGLDLTVETGEMLAVIGKSGSGKSTLLNMIGGLETPTAGVHTIDGKDISTYSEAEMVRYRRDKVGFVWQKSAKNLFPYLTVLQNVEAVMMFENAGNTDNLKRGEIIKNPDIIHADDHIPGGQTLGSGIAFRRHLIHQDALGNVIEGGGQSAHIAAADAGEGSAGHIALIDQFLHNGPCGVAGNGKAQALGILAADFGAVDANDLAVFIDQRAARVARVDRRVGLDEVGVVGHGGAVLAARRDLAVEPRDDALRHAAREVHRLRVADRKHLFAHLDLVGVAEGRRGQVLGPVMRQQQE